MLAALARPLLLEAEAPVLLCKTTEFPHLRGSSVLGTIALFSLRPRSRVAFCASRSEAALRIRRRKADI